MVLILEGFMCLVLARSFEGAYMGKKIGKEVFMSYLNGVGEKEKLMLKHSFVVIV